jgi:hypothetical protein
MRKRKPTKKTKPKTSGSSLLALAIALVCCCSPVLAEKKVKPGQTEAYALLAGTVYRPPGFALAGVELKIEPEQSESNGVRLKRLEAVTDARGEWSVRVPSVPAKWRVDVKVNGYRPEQRSVSVEGEHRVDLSIILEPARQPKEATQ